jgi:hypothetical protein
MKRIAVIIILINLFLVFGCGLTRVDPEAGKKLTENLLSDLKDERYANIDRYYIDSFMAHEPLEDKIAKFRQLRQTVGGITGYKLVSENQKYDDPSGYHQLTLVYKVDSERVPLKMTFIVVKDEGNTGIIAQKIENWDDAAAS